MHSVNYVFCMIGHRMVMRYQSDSDRDDSHSIIDKWYFAWFSRKRLIFRERCPLIYSGNSTGPVSSGEV